MGPLKSIKVCLAKTFDFSGRATRSEFWWFLPFALPSVVVFVWWGIPLFYAMHALLRWGSAFLLLMPVWSAGARRLQDTGEDGRDIFIPAGFFFGVPIGAMIVFVGVTYVSAVIGIVLLMFLVLPIAVIAILGGVTMMGPTIGQLLVPSQRNSNRYGPSPVRSD